MSARSDDPTVVLSTRTKKRLLAQIDARRGGRSRSRYIADLIETDVGDEPRRPARSGRPKPTPTQQQQQQVADQVVCKHEDTVPQPGSVSGLRRCTGCNKVGMGLGRR